MKYWILNATLITMLLMSCNLFEPFASSNGEDYDNFLIKGNNAFSDQNYTLAMEYYEKAQEIDPKRSEAWVFHSKAIMRTYGIEYATIRDEIDKKNEGEVGLPFINECAEDNVACIDSIYHPIAITVRNLSFILDATNDTASTGSINDEVVMLDVALLQAMIAMLNPLDLDKNYHIDEACGETLCGENIDECSGSALAEYNAICTYGADSEVRRFNSFKALTGALEINNLKSDEIDAKNISRNPRDINQFINDISGPAGESNSNLGRVNEAISAHANDTSLAEQLSDITDIVGNLNTFLKFYKSADSVDNDYDIGADSSDVNFVALANDVMVWHDFDNDHAIRFNYDDDYTGSSGITTFHSTMASIGHPVHRDKNPELYLTLNQFKAINSETADDSTDNSRTKNMINFCKTTAELTAGITENYRDILVNSTCEQLSSVLKPEVEPPANASDWVSGTFGIDEEILDDFDNDFDGIKNEDSRLLLGADDDADAIFSQNTPYIVVAMQWTDQNNNGCVDISISDSDDSRTFCIGALEHRLYLAKNRSDSLAIYYIPFTDIVLAKAQAECISDIEFFDIGNGYSTTDISTACTVSHRWALDIPPDSEWTRGTFGIDEELPDGKDNDGDGYIDEDISLGGQN